ncbi:MAG: hypothetical protein MZV64_13670 [Ignavibacteriales bacterium]|nr:hypothetical protein [Ignavibacteriales bacterium]
MLHAAVLQVAGGHVVRARHAQDVRRGRRRRDARRAPADDNRHLGLVIDPAEARGQPDRIAGRDDGRGRLEEDHRLDRQRLALLRRVVLVVEADGDDLARHHRRQHAHGRRERCPVGRRRSRSAASYWPKMSPLTSESTPPRSTAYRASALPLDPVDAIHPSILLGARDSGARR